jgi:hypothetical protein
VPLTNPLKHILHAPVALVNSRYMKKKCLKQKFKVGMLFGFEFGAVILKSIVNRQNLNTYLAICKAFKISCLRGLEDLNQVFSDFLTLYN